MLYRVLTFSTGETKALPLHAYHEQKDARQAKSDRDQAFGATLEFGTLRVGQLSEAFPVSELIEDLGIHAISHTVIEVAIKGPEIQRVEPSILVAGSRH